MLFHSFKTDPSLQDLEDIDDWIASKTTTKNIISISEAWCRQELILIVDQSRNILGFCAFETKESHVKINFLQVKENERRQKLGTYLVEYVMQLMKSKGVDRVEIFVSDLKFKPLWEKLGFQEIIEGLDDSRLGMYFNLNKK
jgi:N-acetylglutamate synthase-like GNAT family acetyltransferase